MLFNISIFFIICAILYLVLEIRRYYKQHLYLSIHQIEYLNKNTFDELVYSQLPVIIRKMDEQLPLLYTNKNAMNDIVSTCSYLKTLHSILSFDHTLSTSQEFDGIYTSLKDRTIIGQLEGETTLKLFSPSQKPFLYTNKKHSIHEEFLYSSEKEMLEKKKEYPLFNKSKYIEIKLNKGNFIVIPYMWSFSLQTNNNDTIITSSNTIVSKLLQWISV